MSRTYQQHFVDELLPEAWAHGHSSVILALPIGAGKTRCVRMVSERLLSLGGWDVLVIDHRRELTDQFAQEFAHLDPGVYYAGKLSPKPSPLRIAGKDTLIRRDWIPTNRKLFLIIDECHHASYGNTYHKLIEKLKAQYEVVFVLGDTATPYRLDGKPLGKLFTHLIEPTTPLELMQAGIIVEPRVIGLDAPDTRGLHVRGGDFLGTDLEVRSRKLIGNVVAEFKKWSDGYPGILRACSIAHSRELCERLKAAGFRAAHMDGETPHVSRDEIFARLAIGGELGREYTNQGIDVLCQVDVASEGWNPPSDYERVLRLKALLWPGSSEPPPHVPLCVASDCRPTMSRSGYIQYIGRGGRPCDGAAQTSRGPMPALPKPWFRLLSHSDNHRRFGLLRDHHGFDLETGEIRGAAREPRDKDGFLRCRYCPKCLSVWPSGVKLCACGALIAEPRPAPQETEQKLKFIPAGARADAGKEAKIAYLASLLRSHARKNAARVVNGQEPIRENQVRCIYHGYAGRWPSNAEMEAAKRLISDEQ